MKNIKKIAISVIALNILSQPALFSMNAPRSTRPGVNTRMSDIPTTGPAQLAVLPQGLGSFIPSFSPKPIDPSQIKNMINFEALLEGGQDIAKLVPSGKDASTTAQNISDTISTALQNLPDSILETAMLGTNLEQLSKGVVNDNILRMLKSNADHIVKMLDPIIAALEYPTLTLASLKMGYMFLGRASLQNLPAGQQAAGIIDNLLTIADKNSSEIATISEGIARILTTIQYTAKDKLASLNLADAGKIFSDLRTSIINEVQEVMPVIMTLVNNNKEMLKNIIDQLKNVPLTGNLKDLLSNPLSVLEKTTEQTIMPMAR